MSNNVKYIFDDWFSILLPDDWTYEENEYTISIYNTKNPKGAIQISLYDRTDPGIPRSKLVKDELERFLNQFDVRFDVNTKKVIDAPNFTLANASGICDGDFIKVWTIVNDKKFLLITYNSPKKTRELSTVDNIIYSISFEE